jgi:hypothetical protein
VLHTSRLITTAPWVLLGAPAGPRTGAPLSFSVACAA